MGLLGNIWVKLGLDNSDFKKGLNESKGKANQFSSAVNKIGGMIAGAFAIGTLTRFGNEISKLAAKSEGVERAFKKIADTSTLSALRDATQGMVSDLDLMRNTVKANNFKIPLSQLATYFNFATARAAETGESVDYLVDSIITGLGRQSVMILDNLGLSAAELRKEIEGGKTMAEAVGTVIQREMGDASKAVSETARQSAQLTVEWENFKVSLGDTLNKLVTPILKGINGIVDATRKAREEAEAGTKQTFWGKMGQMLNPLISQTQIFAGQSLKAYRDATKEVTSYITSVEKAKSVLKDIDAGAYSITDVNVNEIKAFAEDFIKQSESVSKSAVKEGDSIEKLQEDLALLKKAYIGAHDSAKRMSIKAQIIDTQKLIDAKLAEGDIIGGLIPRLEKEIEKKTELLKFAKDETGIRVLNDEIAKLQKKLSLLKMTSEEYAKYNAGRVALPAAPATPSAISGAKVVSTSQNALDKDLKANGEYYKAQKQQRDAALKSQEEDLYTSQRLAEEFGSSVAGSVTESFGMLTDAIVGISDLDSGALVAALLMPFADMAIKLGELAVATGVTALALKALVDFPATAIAAGVALIAVGSLARSGLKSIASGGSAQTITPQTVYTGGASGMTENSSMDAVSVIRGEDIYLIYQKQANKRSR